MCSLCTGLQLTVGPGESASRQAGVCLLSPGLYQLGLQHVQCRPAQQPQQLLQQQAPAGRQQQQQPAAAGAAAAACNTLVLVEPCYVLAVEEGEGPQG